MSETAQATETAAIPRGAQPAREAALVPPSAISARSLLMVITIMSFLASMAAGSAVLVSRASQQWSAGTARQASVQIRARPGLDMDAEADRVAALVRKSPGVAAVHVFTRAESERLLEPWLGQNLNFDDLPVPRMIVVDLEGSASTALDGLRKTLSASAPNAIFDDHRAWSDRLSTMGKTLVFLAIVVLLLILLAMALAVAFATSGAMAGSREIVDVLHLVGAEDSFISRQYQKQFLMFGLKGGCIGSLIACAAFLLIGAFSRAWIAAPGGGQTEALFGSFALGLTGYVCVALVALSSAAVAALTSRLIVARQLRALA